MQNDTNASKIRVLSSVAFFAIMKHLNNLWIYSMLVTLNKQEHWFKDYRIDWSPLLCLYPLSCAEFHLKTSSVQDYIYRTKLFPEHFMSIPIGTKMLTKPPNQKSKTHLKNRTFKKKLHKTLLNSRMIYVFHKRIPTIMSKLQDFTTRILSWIRVKLIQGKVIFTMTGTAIGKSFHILPRNAQ